MKTVTDGVTTLLRSAKEDREVLQGCMMDMRHLVKELQEERKAALDVKSRQALSQVGAVLCYAREVSCYVEVEIE